MGETGRTINAPHARLGLRKHPHGARRDGTSGFCRSDCVCWTTQPRSQSTATTATPCARLCSGRTGSTPVRGQPRATLLSSSGSTRRSKQKRGSRTGDAGTGKRSSLRRAESSECGAVPRMVQGGVPQAEVAARAKVLGRSTLGPGSMAGWWGAGGGGGRAGGKGGRRSRGPCKDFKTFGFHTMRRHLPRLG